MITPRPLLLLTCFAIAFNAMHAAEIPRELAIRTKATLRHTPTLTSHDTAMRFELEHQIWSLQSGFGAAPSGR